MSAKSTNKGKAGEREVAKLFRRWFPDARRSFGQARNGYEQPDIIGGVEEHFYVEVKRYKKIYPSNITNWWNKVCNDFDKYLDWLNSKSDEAAEAYLDNDPEIILIVRGDNSDWIVLRESKIDYKDGLDRQSWEDFANELDKRFPVHAESGEVRV